MRPRTQSHIRVAQAVGSVPFTMQAFDSATIGRQLAHKLGGEVLYLSSPMMADSPKSAEVIRRQPHVQATLAAARQADVALVGIGALDPAQSRLVEAGFVQVGDIKRLIAQHAVGDVAGQMIRADGRALESAHNKRVIGVTLKELAKVPISLAVAVGADKAAAILGALRTRACNVFCTDEDTALLVLRLKE